MIFNYLLFFLSKCALQPLPSVVFLILLATAKSVFRFLKKKFYKRGAQSRGFVVVCCVLKPVSLLGHLLRERHWWKFSLQFAGYRLENSSFSYLNTFFCDELLSIQKCVFHLESWTFTLSWRTTEERPCSDHFGKFASWWQKKVSVAKVKLW